MDKKNSDAAASAARRDIAYHLHPSTNLKALKTGGPLVITRGEGVHVWDIDGNKYIEGFASLWCATLGFSEPRLIDAATRMLRRLPTYHGFTGKSHDVGIDLAEKLINMAPVPMSKVFFANSGSEANDTAVKLIRYYNNALGRPKKKKIISRKKAYHGVTLASASLTGIPLFHTDFDLPIDGVLHTDCPHYYRFGQPGETEEDFATRLAENLEKLILAEGPETIAAMFVEPVMGAGGVMVPPATYFDKIQPILKKYDILLVADEVICGFGRTGNMWGCQTYGIEPDMITMAKALTSGYVPMSALMVNEAIYDVLVSQSEKIGMFGHGFTYSFHPLPCAVALEALTIYQERDIVAHVRKVGPRLQDGLKAFADHPLVGEVRGVGLVAAVEVVKNRKTREPFDPKAGVGPYLMKRAEANGLIVRAMGDSLGFSPPLIIAEAEIDGILDAFGRALDETEAWVEKQGLRG